MRVRAGRSKAGQGPQRSHRGNCKKRILHAWYTTYLSGMLVTVSAIVCPCSNRTTVTLHSQKEFAGVRKSDSDCCFRATGGRPSHPRTDNEPPCCSLVAGTHGWYYGEAEHGTCAKQKISARLKSWAANLRISARGQTRKYSLRADAFRFGPDNGHRSIGSACPFGAINRHNEISRIARCRHEKAPDDAGAFQTTSNHD
jgi:hypothetical protein